MSDRERPDWEGILRAHGPPAFDTAWRLLGNAADVEEVMQETLLDAYQCHARQRISNWGGLLRRFAARRAIDRLRRRRDTAPLAPDVPTPIADQPEAAAIARELAERLRRAVAQLSDSEASVFSLHYFGDMTNAEIAEALGLNVGAVGVALHKARIRLKQLLGIAEQGGERSTQPGPVEARNRP